MRARLPMRMRPRRKRDHRSCLSGALAQQCSRHALLGDPVVFLVATESGRGCISVAIAILLRWYLRASSAFYLDSAVEREETQSELLLLSSVKICRRMASIVREKLLTKMTTWVRSLLLPRTKLRKVLKCTQRFFFLQRWKDRGYHFSEARKQKASQRNASRKITKESSTCMASPLHPTQLVPFLPAHHCRRSCREIPLFRS